MPEIDFDSILFPGRVLKAVEGPRFKPHVAIGGIRMAIEEGLPYKPVAYDPFCGAGTLLACLRVLVSPVGYILASDIYPPAVETTRINLGRLQSMKNLELRIDGLEGRGLNAGNEHALLDYMVENGLQPINYSVFQADAFSPAFPERSDARGRIGLLITDPPYGRQTSFVGRESLRPMEATAKFMDISQEYLRKGALALLFLKEEPPDFSGFSLLRKERYEERTAYLYRFL